MPKQYGLPCPVARSLEIIGDRWTLLIVRDLLREGPRKYVELAGSLVGIAPNVLSDRLKLLESNGIVEREFYEQHPPRAKYRLTKQGLELDLVIEALLQWGAKYLYDGVAIVHETCGHETKLISTCEHCGGRQLPRREKRVAYRRAEAATAAGHRPT
ncbi:MAG: helix-turn-helix transcriptional regulator [Chloroflexota bacterium]|nr:helix-turn-helix transcriptional regulator [Chloroflexota bacterium]